MFGLTFAATVGAAPGAPQPALGVRRGVVIEGGSTGPPAATAASSPGTLQAGEQVLAWRRGPAVGPAGPETAPPNPAERPPGPPPEHPPEQPPEHPITDLVDWLGFVNDGLLAGPAELAVERADATGAIVRVWISVRYPLPDRARPVFLDPTWESRYAAALAAAAELDTTAPESAATAAPAPSPDIAAVDRQLATLEVEAATAGEPLTAWYLALRRAELTATLAPAEAAPRYANARQRSASWPAAELATVGSWALADESADQVAPALARWAEAIEIGRRSHPGSLWLGDLLRRRGRLAYRVGALSAAHDAYREALPIFASRAPGSALLAGVLNNFGLVASDRGDLATAQEHLSAALGLKRALGQGQASIANTLLNLGIVAEQRGNLGDAERSYRDALELFTAAGASEVDRAAVLLSLGNVANHRKDHGLAADLFRQVLAIYRADNPGSIEVAKTLGNLATVAEEQGELSQAAEHLDEALALLAELGVGGIERARLLVTRTYVELGRGDLAAARASGGVALAELATEAAGGGLAAYVHQTLGEVARRDRRFADAADQLGKALAIQEHLLPATFDLAYTENRLGHLAADRGEPATALGHYLRAVDTLESQVARLGGSVDVQSGFRAGFHELYQDAIAALVAANRPAEAFHMMERSRARALLSLLAGRELRLDGELPAELRQAWDANLRSYDQAQAELAGLDVVRDARSVGNELARLRQLRDERRRLAEQVRAVAPRLAALTEPRPLDLAATRELLVAGDVLLSYQVGTESTLLFVVHRDGLEVFSLSAAGAGGTVGEAELARRVRVWRRALGVEGIAADPEQGLAFAEELFELLLAPAATLIAPAKRILISPDGPLHVLPFAALIAPAGSLLADAPEAVGNHRPPDEPRGQVASAAGATRSWQYLAEHASLVILPSATVYGELRRRLPTSAAEVTDGANTVRPSLVAFGDPLYHSLQPLPATRLEVEGIASAFPGRAATYLGADASEHHAKSTMAEAHYLHFACHGLLDANVSLDSGLALASPEGDAVAGDNGLLQAWEIYEQTRIRADLVVLSACETALGKTVRGEGLLGLARAFEYAGARAVVASLWSVPDDSTARLMVAFYNALGNGADKDVALRTAQLELIAEQLAVGPDTRLAPWHWAGFVLYGDPEATLAARPRAAN